MGMFDYIECKAKFPDIDLHDTQLTMEQIRQENYQTKSLDCCMMQYFIEEDGTLTFETYPDGKWVENDEAEKSFWKTRYICGKPVKETFTGNAVINFYADFPKRETDFDYWVEWEALIIKGKLTEIKLIEFNKVCNINRKKALQEFEARLRQDNIYRSTWRYKYLDRWVTLVKRKLVKFLITKLQRICSWLYKI